MSAWKLYLKALLNLWSYFGCHFLQEIFPTLPVSSSGPTVIFPPPPANCKFLGSIRSFCLTLHPWRGLATIVFGFFFCFFCFFLRSQGIFSDFRKRHESLHFSCKKRYYTLHTISQRLIQEGRRVSIPRWPSSSWNYSTVSLSSIRPEQPKFGLLT